MCDVCKEENVPEPYYVTDQGYVTIVFKKRTSVTGDFRSDCESSCGIQLTEKQRNIIDILQTDGFNTAKTIAGMLEIGMRSVEAELSFLRKNGFIDKESKDNRSPWLVVKNPFHEKK